MRAIIALSMLVLLCPVAAMAQSAPPTPTSAAASTNGNATSAPRRNADITRDQYIERAKENAGKRFDRMDSNHDGVLTADERRAYREAHHRTRKAAAH